MDAGLLLDLYRQMALCRRFEEAAAKVYTQGKIRGFLHLYIGQEAVAVGAISAAEPTDYIVATYREHAHYLARTGDARAAMAEPGISHVAHLSAEAEGVNQSAGAIGCQAGQRQLVASLAQAKGRVERPLGRLAIAISATSINEVDNRWPVHSPQTSPCRDNSSITRTATNGPRRSGREVGSP